jgi:hypothetical protein
MEIARIWNSRLAMVRNLEAEAHTLDLRLICLTALVPYEDAW